jgi:hypothetical protein
VSFNSTDLQFFFECQTKKKQILLFDTMEMDQDVVMEPVQPVQPKDVDHDMLSPVSKLELAHKYAALEQQRRIETASARVVEAKKQNTFKRKELEARLESHIKKKIHKTISDPKPVQEDEEYDDEEGPQVTVNLLEEFDSEDSDIVMQENNHNNYVSLICKLFVI